jgi:hypothetical protein
MRRIVICIGAPGGVTSTARAVAAIIAGVNL